MEVEGCPLPEDRLYDLDHDVWYRSEEGGRRGHVGLIASLVAFAGRFRSIAFRDVGGVVARGRSVALVESIRYTGAVRLPVDASVLERNPALPGRPKLINDSPYELGWVVRVAPVDPDEAERRLESAAAVRPRLLDRIRELKIRCYPAVPDVELYEIGVECQAILARVDEELDRRAPDEVILLVTDDPTAPIEMVRWSDRTGHAVLHHRVEGNLHHFLLRRERVPIPRPRPTA